MGHFLTACDKANSLLVPLYNMMYSCATRQEERDKLFRAESVYLLKLLCDIRSEFYVRYLRPVDQQVHLVSSTYIANFTATQMERMETALADAYLNTLDVDENENWSSKEKIQDNVYSIRLSNPPRSNAQDKEERVQQVRVKLQGLKGKVTKSLKYNIQDQCDDSTFFNWSGLDLSGLQKNNEIKFVQDLKALSIA